MPITTKQSKALQVLAALAAQNPLALYRPSPLQRRFHASKHKRRLLRAGTQTGKTLAGAVEAWRHAIDCPGSIGLILAANHKAKIEVVGLKMWEVAPRHLLDPSAHYDTVRGWKHDQIRLSNGSLILFRSAESQSTAVAGLTADWLWIDEPPPKGLYGEALSRVAVRNGPAWMTFTPIGRPCEWLRLHIEGDDERGIAPTEEWEQHIIRLTSEDCPHRSPESIRAQTEGYGPWEYAQRVLAEWDGITPERVLDGLSEESVSASLPRLQWSVGLGIDHGELAGHEVCVLVVFERGKNLIWVLDEYVSSTSTTPEEDAHKIRQMLGRHGISPSDVDIARGDVNSVGKLGAGNKVNDLLGHALGIRVSKPGKGPGSIDFGVRLLNVALRRGHLRLHPNAKGTLKALQHWQGKDDGYKHYVDALRYVAVPILEGMYSPVEIDRLRLVRA